MLGPHAEHDVGSTPGRRAALAIRVGERDVGAGHADRVGASAFADDRAPATVFIGGLPMNARDEQVRGPVVDLLRRPDLLEHDRRS